MKSLMLRPKLDNLKSAKDHDMVKHGIWLLLLAFSISPALVGCSTDADSTEAATGEDEPEVEETDEFVEGEESIDQGE